jgi:hypothetical protein
MLVASTSVSASGRTDFHFESASLRCEQRFPDPISTIDGD